MAHFERRFVRPSRFQVVDALVQAAQAAGARLSADEDNRRPWESFVSELHDQPEGYYQWDGSELPGDNTGVVAIAWWTDHLCGRHFRIYGSSSADDGARLVHLVKNDPRPPFWHLAPDQVFGRDRSGAHLWLAVCACGMTGTPQAIGWMGDRCGCCHYKPAEAPAEAPVRFATLRGTRRTQKQLTFSPDGRWLAGAGPGREVDLWDLAEGRYHGITRSSGGGTLALSFTPDGTLMALASSDRLLHFVRVPTGEEVAAYPTPPDVSSVTIAPDNLTLAIAAEHNLEVWGRPEPGLPWLPVYEREGRVCGTAFNPRSNRLAVAYYSELVVLGIVERAGCPHSCQRRWTFSPAGPLAFGANGRSVVSILQHANFDMVVSWEYERNQETSCHSLHGRSTAFALSPDAEWLGGVKDHLLVIEHVSNVNRWCRLRSGHGALMALAFSPDGHTLATANADGAVKLWPWRRLIEA
jgi:WD40 repeat protein